MSLGHHIKQSEWLKKNQRPKNDSDLYQHLEHVERSVKEFMNARLNSLSLNREDLRAYLESKKRDERKELEEKLTKEVEFFQVWDRIIKTAKHPDTGAPLSPNTRRAKMQTYKLLQVYCTNKKLSPTFQTIDMAFYHGFDDFMAAKGLNGNSRGKHFKELKAVLRRATELSIQVHPAHTWKAFKVVKVNCDDTYLSVDELKRLLQLNLKKPQSIYRDIFVMACFVGARHSDWHQIRSSNVVKENSREMIKIRQKKTGDSIHVPLHPVVRMILAKYDGQPPRVISSQKFNDAIKLFCEHKDAKLGKIQINGEEVEKWQEISTHTARRSFATNAYLSRSLDVYQIMKCTGHKSEASFLKYLKLNGKDYAYMAADSRFFNDDQWTSSMNVA
jgi:integrase